jgi:phosphatidate cytidylyltransferase
MIALLYAGAAVGGVWTVAILCAFLCWQGAHEYAALTALGFWSSLLLALLGWLTLLALLISGQSVLVVAPIVAFFLWSLVAIYMVEHSGSLEKGSAQAFQGFWGYLYVGWLPAHLVGLALGKVPGLVLVIGLGVALSDIGAFCVGKLLRGPKLAPQLSPGKTWSGVLGNLLGAGLTLLFTRFLLPGLLFWQVLLFVFMIGLGSVWGDLLESMLKRRGGVKDAGTLLPGFGGLLDRIDSLLLVAPLVYYLSRWMMG